MVPPPSLSLSVSLSLSLSLFLSLSLSFSLSQAIPLFLQLSSDVANNLFVLFDGRRGNNIAPVDELIKAFSMVRQDTD